jgi:hypothetical protein
MSNIKDLISKLQRAVGQDEMGMTQMPMMMQQTQMGGESPAMAPEAMQMPMEMEMGENEMPEMEEMDTSEVDEETKEMFMSDINALIANAGDIAQHVEQGKEIEAWMLGKITLAADYISAVRDNFVGDK